MTTDREGNVLKVPSRSVKTKVGGEEILSSYARFTQGGGTLASAQGVLEAGTVLSYDSAQKRYVKYTAAGASANEVQSVTETGSPTGGTFTLTYATKTTTAIAQAATAATVQAALVALSNIGPGDVAVTGSAGGPYTVTFVGALADTNVAQMTATASLTGGTSPGVTVATVTAGTTGAALGFLRSSVDATDEHQCNIVRSGIVKLDVVLAANGWSVFNATAQSDLNGRVDPTALQFIF